MATDPETQNDHGEAAVISTAVGEAIGSQGEYGGMERLLKRIRFFFRASRSTEVSGGREGRWSLTELKRRSPDIMKQLEEQGPQVIANVKEHAKEPMVLVYKSEMDALLKTVRKAMESRFATGADLFRELAHNEQPSETASRPRKKVFQNRRSMSAARAAQSFSE